MASRPKTRSTEAAKPSRLGNDPFQRGAAPAAPAPVPLAHREPEAISAPDDARPQTKAETPVAKTRARPKSKPSAARPKSQASEQARPKSKSVAKAEKPEKATARPATAKTPRARPVTQPLQAAPAPQPAPEEPAAALVKHVHVPEVEHGPEAHEEPPQGHPEPPRDRAGMFAQLAMHQAQNLAGKLMASPTALQTAAAAISGATAVRALLAAPPGPRTVDDFGEDPALVARTAPTLEFLYRHYFRVSVSGAENLPQHGPLLSIANHAGAMPLDGPMVRSALERSRERTRARWLVEDALFHAPFVGTLLNRLGAVRACPENAERLLQSGAALVVFPEGVNALTKTFRRRYQLQRFGRGGFVKLALRTGAPLVPTAVLGAEESMPILATLSAPALGLPVLPVTPSLLPLPTKWQIRFLPPVDLSKYTPADANDLALVQRITEEVRTAIHGALDEMRAARQSVFRG